MAAGVLTKSEGKVSQAEWLLQDMVKVFWGLSK